MKRILIIEDEKELAELLSFNLEKEGYRACIARDGASGLESAKELSPDLILLDVMLPRMNGFEVCRLLKENTYTAHIPVLILTARGEEVDRVVGFEVGADDYVRKPFSIREVLLRIRAVLRRERAGEPKQELVTVGDVTIDIERHLVFVRGRTVSFTATEYKLLLVLAERAGRVQSREQLLKDVWGFSHTGDTRTVDTHITRLRTKLGDAGDRILTIRGFGYKIEPG